MYRTAMEKLYKWKESKRRKPLIIEGARQVGKTWLMKEFGRQAYTSTVYINFDSNSRMTELFASDLNIDRLILGIELYTGQQINPENTLLLFDEIQEVPRALSSLKYFCEDAPQYHIICAGSLLGIALHEGTSFPVGKVDFLSLFPPVIPGIFDGSHRGTFCRIAGPSGLSDDHSPEADLYGRTPAILFCGRYAGSRAGVSPKKRI